MACFHPITAYQPVNRSLHGRKLLFKKPRSFATNELQIPCGQCSGCRLEHSRQWAIRCVHEASLHDSNSFITLTYDAKNLPEDGGLQKKHFQNFIRYYRRYLNKYEGGKKIRYFHCGEYGETNTKRPHYHALIFGHDFNDKRYLKTINGNRLYASNTLDRIWAHGHCSIGTLTFESAAYVARYALKKIRNNETSKEHYFAKYNRVDPETGELHFIQPEYVTMSRRPGIGSQWFDKYQSDVYPSDEVILQGKKMRPPKYYDSLYEGIEDLKKERKTNARQHKENNTPERLAVREKCLNARLNFLPRQLED